MKAEAGANHKIARRLIFWPVPSSPRELRPIFWVMPAQLPWGLHRAYARLVAPVLADECSRRLDLEGRVLDVGCGSGHLVRRLRSRGCDVVGIDPDPLQVRMAARKAPTIHLGVAEAMPFADGRFDAVIATESLHHWQSLPAAVDEVHRILRPGGRFVVLEGRGKSSLKQVNRRLGLPPLGPARPLLRLIFRPSGMSRQQVARVAVAVEAIFGHCTVEADGDWWRLCATRAPVDSV